MGGSVLLVDDDEDMVILLSHLLRRGGFTVETAGSAQECLDRLRTSVVDVVITDVEMPGMSGVALCTVLKDSHPDLVSIVLTGMADLETAVGAIRGGAFDFIAKPVKAEVLIVAVERALAHLSLKQEVKRLRADADRERPIAGMIGSSVALRQMTEMIRRVADSDTMVLITGESGTGKELVARALHDLSSRSHERFVAVNCAAMPAPLLESELFGHVRGAFTDAKASRNGLFLQAGAGTIFLDEIGDMPLEMQVKLLRVLQERTVRPVGGDEEVPFLARVVTATNRDLETEVEEKRFREDLFYRINVVSIPVPALRTRGPDVLQLAHHIIDRLATRSGKPPVSLTPEASRKLLDYEWPGNIRELENCLERAVAVCGGSAIAIDDLPIKVQHYQPKQLTLSTTPAEMITLHEMELRYVRQVLNSVSGNKTHAARLLGMDRRSLYRRLETTAPIAARPDSESDRQTSGTVK